VGHATCADGLACDQTGPANGTCTYYCGAGASTCPSGYECRETHIGGPTGPAIDICRGAGLVDDGGVPFESGTYDDGGCIQSITDGGGFCVGDANADGGPQHQ
jgi:hypothetical protein